MVKYVKGKSCIQKGGKHHFVTSGTGNTQHCTKCGSVRGVGKKSKSKSKKRAKPAAESGVES